MTFLARRVRGQAGRYLKRLALSITLASSVGAIGACSGPGIGPPASLSHSAGTSSATPSETPGSAVTASFSGLEYDRATQTFNAVMTLTNNGTTTVSGPITVVIATGTSAVTVAGSADGSSYIANVPGGQIIPGQSATVVVEFADPTHVQFTPLIASIVVGAAATVKAVKATVTIDPSAPASVESMITEIVSPLDSQPLGTPLYVPVSEISGESMVLAVDANKNILLASLTTTNAVTLSSSSTALAVVRLAIGALPSSAVSGQLNAAIQGTMEFPHLVTLISAALTANTSPVTSSSVYSSIATILTQLPGPVVTALQTSNRAIAHAQAAPVDVPSVTTSLPYALVNFSTKLPQTVSVTGTVATTGNVQVSNSTLIAWALASTATSATTATSGRSLCLPNTGTSATNPDCSVVVPQTDLLHDLGSVVSSSAISSGTVEGNAGGSFNLTLEQNYVSHYTNVVQIGGDLVATIAFFSTGAESASLGSCVKSFEEAVLPPDAAAKLAADPTGAALESYLEGEFSAVSLAKSLLECGSALFPSSNAGSWTFAQSVTAFAFGLSRFALNEVSGVATAAGLPAEIYWTIRYWPFGKNTFGVCEAQSPPNLVISNCAQSFAFNPGTVTLVPGGSFTSGAGVSPNSVTPILNAYLGANGSGATTLVPPDLMYSSPQDPSVIELNTSTGAVVAQPLPSGTTTASATVTVTETSTGITASYRVNVNSVPTFTVTANPTSLPASSGSVTLTATLGPPAGAIPGSPTPTGKITFTDTTGATFCAQPVTVQAGVATCVANVAIAPDLITAKYSGDTTYAPNSANIAIGLGGQLQLIVPGGGPPSLVCPGGTLRLVAAVPGTDGGGNPLPTPPNLVWVSSAPAVATVSADPNDLGDSAVVAGILAGTSTISATDPVSGITGALLVSVTPGESYNPTCSTLIRTQTWSVIYSDSFGERGSGTLTTQSVEFGPWGISNINFAFTDTQGTPTAFTTANLGPNSTFDPVAGYLYLAFNPTYPGGEGFEAGSANGVCFSNFAPVCHFGLTFLSQTP